MFSIPPDTVSTTTDVAVLTARLTAVEARIRELQKILPGLAGDRRHESEIELRDLLRTRVEIEGKLRAPTPLTAVEAERRELAERRRQAIIANQVREVETNLTAFILKMEQEGDWRTARMYRNEMLLARERAERMYPP